MTSCFEDVVARDAPRVLGALVRRYGSVADCEDAVQLALMAAVEQWPVEGTPQDPRAWLMTVARRRLIDDVRTSTARRERESLHLADMSVLVDPFDGANPAGDDTLACLLMCADPALSRASQVALTLRVVSGLTTAQIASAFFVAETTMGQRISRAKTTLRRTGADFRDDNLSTPERLSAVRHVLYLVFNEGYTCSGGDFLLDVSLAAEAIRLTRQLLLTAPGDTETMGLLSLMLLTHSRTATRTDERGDLVVLAEQNRSQWDHHAIAEGVRLVERALISGRVGPFQVQAAIAAIHAEARTWSETDWAQILLLYRMLETMNPGPAVSLNLAVATAMADIPEAGLAITRRLLDDPAAGPRHRVHAVHAHLLSMAGEREGAGRHFLRAASLATSAPEQRYLLKLAAQQA